MPLTKPIGFDNFRTYSFIANDGSAFTFFRKASFSRIYDTEHKLFTGPSIASTSADADCIITTDEPHGFKVGQEVVFHGLTFPVVNVLDGQKVITSVPTTTTFTVGEDTTVEGATTGVGIVGVDIEARIPVAQYACVPGANCADDHPAAWEIPIVG